MNDILSGNFRNRIVGIYGFLFAVNKKHASIDRDFISTFSEPNPTAKTKQTPTL